MTTPTVLIIDDDPEYSSDLAGSLGLDFTCRIASTGEAGLGEIVADAPDAVVLDLMLAGGRHGLDILTSVRTIDASLPVIIVTDFPSTETETEALKRGALYYVRKAAGRAEVVTKLHKCLEVARTERERDRLRHESDRGPTHDRFLTRSPALLELMARLDRIAAAPSTTVLITGESGTGKSLLAREIHWRSQRARRRFREVNLALLQENLARDDLFGHRRNAYTGADQEREGWFESVKGGTLCLSEISDLPCNLQGHLLQAIEERQLYRLGESTPRTVDARVIASTNRDLEAMVKKGTFRQDLLGRLSVVTIHVPPLREHPEDIPLLAQGFLARCSREMPFPQPAITAEAFERLRRYSWRRNNVRELRNRIEAAVVLYGSDGSLGPGAFELPENESPEGLDYGPAKEAAIREFQRRFFERAFLAAGSSLANPHPEATARVANLTGIPPQTVRRILRESLSLDLHDMGPSD